MSFKTTPPPPRPTFNAAFPPNTLPHRALADQELASLSLYLGENEEDYQTHRSETWFGDTLSDSAALSAPLASCDRLNEIMSFYLLRQGTSDRLKVEN